MQRTSASIGRDHYITEIRSDSGNLIIADEPADNGGLNKGFSPDELLASALGACTCITLRMYADRKGWALEKMEVTVSLERNNTDSTTSIKRTIILYGNLSIEEKTRLIAIADKCPTHKTLTNPIEVITSFQ